MSQTADAMEMTEAQIAAQADAAMRLLDGFDHAPRLGKAVEAPRAERSPGIGTRSRFRSTTPGLATRRSVPAGGVHLRETVEGEGLITPARAGALKALHRALSIALAAGAAFEDRTGLDALKAANMAGRLPEADAAKFRELLEADALAVGHSFANALAFLLAPLRGPESREVPPPEEVLTDNAQLMLEGLVWEIDQRLAGAGDDDALIATLAAQAEVVMARLADRARQSPRAATFGEVRYRIEADDLVLDGFTPATAARGKPLVMQFKKPHEVVGNHIAKHQALKLSKMLMAYDFERRLNPFVDLGGFIFTFMGDGAPGTGKTTLIQMMAGMINEYCQVAGYPFRYENLSTESIDSYQGKSAQNAKAFIDGVLDPQVIGFGTIDDIDQLAGKRGDRQSSAGQLEITAVLMQAFAGANTVVRGNCTFGMFSNYPENVDDALRQRAGARFLVDGPQTREDYIDILSLLLGKRHDIPLGDHDLFAAQELTRAVAESFEKHSQPAERKLAQVFEDVRGRIGELDTIAKIGTYLKGIQEADERFTGRAIKNITDAVKVRSLDVELPDEWFETADAFMHRPYDEKLARIEEMRVPITVEMVIQEINRYADSEFRYADKSDEVAIEDAVRDMGRMEEAKRRYMERRG
ncbi:AAA family ATPase [Jannaschia aquimarina]|uniref:ATPase family associated with various cellular activities (AAA) n=1 Tax=Jannaschia aquimarina TaxID=935700 RepID=A0A0D1EFM5_9RHOB|nr:ATP-binding protein [Jannaschia aquimarina]KIT16469.1 ATPase family associated with various cellular activities (AAA) [Jannaschia aquimarina]SNT07817.1 ATPase family associated with various cellular activities (AAA) [Jannaschia aquimarina]